ncbi:hypothetical protein [Methanofollis fontis]|uniref:Uncharacterized protein n=1 Tax=Methanofollis fontis TaxID=2052832 RepID=A0A483CN12_9EURY|nr:hypothetical protein [Methanofollis fontis]TAJ43340.1 hypothetical protein CUJ86_11345 [Methanofollis fontis]
MEHPANRIAYRDSHTRYGAETDAIWEETGFFPSPACCATVELLHRLFMVGGADPDEVDALVRQAEHLLHTTGDGDDGITVTDPLRVFGTASEYGITLAGKTPDEAAMEITREIVADYRRAIPP